MGTMRRFKRSIRDVNGKLLAFEMRVGFGAALVPLMERIVRGRVDDSEIREMFIGHAEAEPNEASLERAKKLAAPAIFPSAKAGKYSALISCKGVATYDIEYQPYAFSTLRLSQEVARLTADPQIESIFLDIDSPGGYVTGTQEAADAIFAARKKKRVAALVNPLAASAAYWIASQAETIIGVPSADVGSIGVFMCHYDCSAMLKDMGLKPTFIFAGEYKTEGNSMEPLSEEGKAFYQSQVDGTYTDFINAVARGRGVTPQAVMDKFGKGRCYDARMAKKLGMIDEISTIQGALASWGIPDLTQEANRRRASDEKAGERGEEQDDSEHGAEAGEAAYDPNAPLEVNADSLLMEGCGVTAFMQITMPGVITTYVKDPWPEKIAIHPELLKHEDSRRSIHVVGDTITIAVANGAAVYTKIGETSYGALVCRLEPGSSFDPGPVSAKDDAADKPDAAAEPPVPDHKTEAERVRLRIAMLT